MKIKNRIYYTLLEVLSYYDDSLLDDDAEEIIIDGKVVSDFWYNFLENVYGEIQADTFWKDTKIDTLICSYILPTFIDEYACFIDDEEITEDVAFKSFIRHFNAKLRSTYEQYSKIIATYETYKAQLTADINSTRTAIFNDTPQGTGTYTDDTHTTTYNKTTTTTNVATPMQRLNEVNRLLKSYYQEWADTFHRMFI